MLVMAEIDSADSDASERRVWIFARSVLIYDETMTPARGDAGFGRMF